MAMDVSKLVDKARECVERRNYGYAIELYQQALTLSPNDVEARKELRAVGVRHVKENGISTAAAAIKGIVPRIKLMLPSKDAERKMISAEQYLMNDPGSVSVLTKLGDAAWLAGHRETAIWVFEDMVASNPQNADAVRGLAHMYEAAEMWDEALESYKRIEKLKPGDREAPSKVKDISATRMATHIQDATQGAAGGHATRAVLKDDDETMRRQIAETGGRTPEEINMLIGFIKEDIAKKPDDDAHVHNLWVRLGDQYMRIKEFPQAQTAYDRAKELSPTEYRIDMKIQDVEMGKLKTPMDQLVVKMKKAPDEETKKQLAAAQGAYYKYRLECFIAREKNYITDLNIAFELGNLYYRFKKYDDAAKRYQKTQNDPSRRSQSLLRLGVCFSYMGQEGLAEEGFSNGIDSIDVPIGQSDIKKELTYQRAVLLQKIGRNDDAKKDFQSLYAVDISFRDVGERLKQLG